MGGGTSGGGGAKHFQCKKYFLANKVIRERYKDLHESFFMCPFREASLFIEHGHLAKEGARKFSTRFRGAKKCISLFLDVKPIYSQLMHCK